MLHSLPLWHALVVRTPVVPVLTPVRFRVQLHSLAAQECGGRSPCYEALLPDAVP